MEAGEYIEIPSELRRKANDNALHTFGKAYIFEHRACRFSKRLMLLKWLGVAVPLLVYGIIAPFSLDSTWQNILIGLASIASTILLILSAWSMAANWDIQYSKSFQAQIENYELYRLYKELAGTTLMDYNNYSNEMKRLDSLLQKVDNLNMQLSISDSEKILGMRAGLREFQRKCVGCNLVPTDLEPSNCNICGKFKKRRWI